MSKSLWAPHYWPARLGLVLARALTRLPLPAQLWLGRRLGDLTYFVVTERRRVARINIRLCFPEYTERQRHQLTRETFQAAGMGLMETFYAWWGEAERLRPVVQVDGLEHLERARAGGGVILLSAHFTALELGLRLLSLHVPITAMYRPHGNLMVNQAIRRGRQSHTHGDVIAKDDVRGLLRALRAGRVIWYGPDQGVQRGAGLPVPFFGHPAITTTATPRLAKVTRAPVLPFFTLRTENPPGYRLLIQPPLDDFPGDDEAQDTARVNRVLEDIIRQAPEQYFWLHKRFKRMPGGDPYRKE